MQISGKELLVGVTLEDIENIATENPSLRGYLQGYVAEMFLKRKLDQMSGIDNVSKIRDHDDQKGDFRFNWQGREVTIEVKSMATKTVREDLLNGGFNARVGLQMSDAQVAPDGSLTRTAERGRYDILAISAFAIGKGWDFYFIANKYLPPSPNYPERLSTCFTVNTANTPCLHTDLYEVLEDLYN